MWFNSQCAKVVKAKNHRFKAWTHHQTPQSRTSFVQARNLCSKTINNAKTFVNRISNKIASCQTGSRSFWSLAKVVSQNFCHSSFPTLKNNSGSSSCTPSSKANLFASTLASSSNVDDQESQPPFYPTSNIEYRSDDITKIYFWNFEILTMWSERAPYNRHASKVSDK